MDSLNTIKYTDDKAESLIVAPENAAYMIISSLYPLFTSVCSLRFLCKTALLLLGYILEQTDGSTSLPHKLFPLHWLCIDSV